MNILQQYKAAVARRGGNTMVEIQTGPLEIGDEFNFVGYSWQRVGETVRISYGNRIGYAKIIKDAGYCWVARRTK